MSLGFDDEQEQERVRGRSRRRPDLQAGTPSGHEEGASDGIRRVRQARERAREEGLTEQEDVPAGSGISADRESRPARTGAEHHPGTRPETAVHDRELRSRRQTPRQEHRGSHREQRRLEQEKKKKTRRRIIAMVIAECFTLLLIFGYGYYARHLNLIQGPEVNKDNVINEDLQVEDLQKMEGYWMIAVFGVDSRDGNVGAGVQSDVNMICCINQDTGEIRLVSLYRDTYLNTSDSGRYSKFNEAYARGGPEQALKFLNKNLDLNITDYITFSWKAVAEAIHILGGVDVEITKAEYRYINSFITETVESTGIGSHQLDGPGMHHLDGVQAVAYGRLRLMDSDYARTERQRKIIELAFAKAKEADYATLNNVLVTVLPQVSHNLDFGDLTNVALNISKYHIGETQGFPTERSDANMGSKGLCVIPRTLVSNVSQLHTFLFGDENYQPTSTVQQISDKILSDVSNYSGGRNTGTVTSTTAAQTAEETPEESGSGEGETDADGNRIPETDADGNPIRETDANGNLILETDADGNLILETDDSGSVLIPSYPGIGETDADGNLVDGPDDWEEPESYGPGYTGQNGPGQTRPTGPGTETSAAGADTPSGPGSSTQTGPSGPGGNTPSETTAASPGTGREPTEESTYGPGSSTQTSPSGPGSTGQQPSQTPVQPTSAASPAEESAPSVPSGPGTVLPEAAAGPGAAAG